MHRDTPSCATQQPGLPPPLLSVHAQQARPLPNTPHEGHARASFRNACRRSAQTTATPLPRGVLYTSRTLDILRAPLHTRFILACELRSYADSCSMSSLYAQVAADVSCAERRHRRCRGRRRFADGWCGGRVGYGGRFDPDG